MSPSTGLSLSALLVLAGCSVDERNFDGVGASGAAGPSAGGSEDDGGIGGGANEGGSGGNSSSGSGGTQNAGAANNAGSSGKAEADPGDAGGTPPDDLCSTNPCQNEGTCSVVESATRCSCIGGFAGPTCTARILAVLPRAGCRAEGVSGNGQVVVGSCTDAGVSQAISWTGNEGDAVIPLPFSSGGAESAAFGVNANGLVIVGESDDSTGNPQAVRWVGGTVLSFQSLASLESYQNRASRTSADGSIVVGDSDRAGEYSTAVRWEATSGSPTNLAAGAGHEWSYATGVSADGTLVVGYGTDESGAFTWTLGAGYAALSGLTASNDNHALGVSDDGLVIIGTSGAVAVRWLNRVPESLGGLADPLGVSADGSVIVGRIGNGAFIWTALEGMRTLDAVLGALSVDLNGFVPASATDVSDDGTIIVGYGTLNGSEHAFRLTLPAQ